MVQAPAAAPPRPLPAGLLGGETVQRAERIAESIRLQPPDEGALRRVPALAAILAQAAIAVARERPDAAVGVLAPRRVQVSAERARMVGSSRQVCEERLVR